MNDMIYPSYSEVNLGQYVEFKCNSTRNLLVLWVFNQGPIENYATKTKNGKIIIKTASLHNMGYYSCYVVAGPWYRRQRFVATAQLKVFGRWCGLLIGDTQCRP